MNPPGDQAIERLRIGIDGFNFALPNATGVATYGIALAQTLRGMGHGVEGIFGIDAAGNGAMREVSFFDRLSRPEKRQPGRSGWRQLRERIRAARGMKAIDVPDTGRVARRAFAERMPEFDRLTTAGHLFEDAYRHFRMTGRFVELTMDRPPDVMHWTYPVPVSLAGARNIYTLHDLVPLRLPHTTLDHKLRYQALVRSCTARAAQICTVSEASRADIVAWLGIAPEKVTNTYQASPIGPGILADDPAADARTVEATFGLRHRSYFLFFGALEPKKNVGRLIEAYLSSGITAPLVIAGAPGWGSEDELRLLGGTAGRRIVQPGYLPRALLLRLVRGARAVVFPSLYEGFGLPVLEAMQLGVPVLTSRMGGLPEVAGDAALVVDPYSVGEIAAAMRSLDSDAALREALAAQGPVQAARFGEAAYRGRLVELYRRAMD